MCHATSEMIGETHLQDVWNTIMCVVTALAQLEGKEVVPRRCASPLSCLPPSGPHPHVFWKSPQSGAACFISLSIQELGQQSLSPWFQHKVAGCHRFCTKLWNYRSRGCELIATPFSWATTHFCSLGPVPLQSMIRSLFLRSSGTFGLIDSDDDIKTPFSVGTAVS